MYLDVINKCTHLPTHSQGAFALQGFPHLAMTYSFARFCSFSRRAKTTGLWSTAFSFILSYAFEGPMIVGRREDVNCLRAYRGIVHWK